MDKIIEDTKTELNKYLDYRDSMTGCHIYRIDDSNVDSLFRHLTAAIIQSEIDRKKGMLKDTPYDINIDADHIGAFHAISNQGYNIAITRDVQYWENVLEELEKNV